MWKELQTSSKAGETTKSASLDQAAAALETVPSPQKPPAAVEPKAPTNTLEQLFKVAQEQAEIEKSTSNSVEVILLTQSFIKVPCERLT